MYGYTREELIGKNIADMVAPASRAAVAEAVRAGREGVYEHQSIRKDGSVFLTEARAKMVRVGSRAVRMTALRDVTQRRQAEAALQEREGQLRLFVEHSPAAIVMLDCDMKYLVVSRRWQEDFHLDEQAIIGRSHYEIFPEIPPRWIEIHRRCLAGAVEKCDEDSFPRADGTTEYLR